MMKIKWLIFSNPAGRLAGRIVVTGTVVVTVADTVPVFVGGAVIVFAVQANSVRQMITMDSPKLIFFKV